jgi:hypothetical protein
MDHMGREFKRNHGKSTETTKQIKGNDDLQTTKKVTFNDSYALPEGC